MSRSEWSLHEFMRQVWDDMGGCDYHVLAKETRRRLPAQRQGDALDQALIKYASWFNTGVSRSRPQHPHDSQGCIGAGVRNSARSAKVAGYRAAWPALERQYAASGGERKALGDCDAADLEAVAANLDGLAASNTAKAEWLRKLRCAVITGQAARVRDLPADVLAGFFGKQARP